MRSAEDRLRSEIDAVSDKLIELSKKAGLNVRIRWVKMPSKKAAKKVKP